MDDELEEDRKDQMSGGFMITGRDKIEGARWLALRTALKLEIHGLRRSRGKSARYLANQITGKNDRTARAAYTSLNAKIVEVLGAEFDKPIP